ncbi:uncharacterized protein LOC141690997 [Apium graveolens]|uniref:uncharacterized protein LOC141690997 n=1 Tax=Apium graveolens TaxID=4045 RepID=UPI003D7BB92D
MKVLEVDIANLETIEKLPLPSPVKGVRSFLGYAGFYKRFIKDYSKFLKPFYNLLEKYTKFVYDDSCLVAYEELKKKLVSALIIISQFDLEIKDKKGSENQVADHLSRLENHENSDSSQMINDSFSDEKLMDINTKGLPWFADFVNYLLFPDNVLRRCILDDEIESFLNHCHNSPYDGHLQGDSTARKVLQSEVELFDVWGIESRGPFMMAFQNQYILLLVDYISKWAEDITTLTNDASVVLEFLKKNISTQFGIPKAITSDEGTNFCNKQISTLLLKYGVHHKVACAYHLQTNGQAEVSNRKIK